MGRKLVLITLALGLGLSGCTSPSESPLVSAGDDIVLMPHHLIVKPIIEQTYADLATDWAPQGGPAQVIIISPDHFHQGAAHISAPPESEFGFTIHRDYARATWPNATITGYMIQNEATEQEIDDFVATVVTQLTATPALVIFSVDFSHYLPGDVSQLHDLRSIDILRARDSADARSIEADCPTALEIMLRLLAARGETLEIDRNTNPALDAGVRTFDNTTHVFAHSRPLAPGETPPARAITTTMFFAHPMEWYAGKTQEDRYLYGYDRAVWNGLATDPTAQDHALIQTTGQPDQTYTFDYF